MHGVADYLSAGGAGGTIDKKLVSGMTGTADNMPVDLLRLDLWVENAQRCSVRHQAMAHVNGRRLARVPRVLRACTRVSYHLTDTTVMFRHGCREHCSAQHAEAGTYDTPSHTSGNKHGRM